MDAMSQFDQDIVTPLVQTENSSPKRVKIEEKIFNRKTTQKFAPETQI